ncbi:MAG: YjbQ family protein [Desulfobacteraceae bacterium]|nr:YjbQ family protein [Desulfobacteraceae bacterium]MBC2756460.1 YjbQ family protein [Desulfobacteraceae bacterium]MBC2763590.1 YjbQ family protein [ANME-2 cluster archaeon]
MKLTVTSRNKTQFIDITSDIQNKIKAHGIENGLCFVFVPHTTAGITINENADPSVQSDMLNVFNTIIPWKLDYRHLEGNSPAHVKSSLVGASEIIAIENGQLVLGTWQGVYFCEFDGPRTRYVNIKFIKE